MLWFFVRFVLLFFPKFIMERELYARHVIEKKLSNIFRTQLQRDYMSELLDRYFQNIIDVAQLTFGVKHAAFNARCLPVFNLLTPVIALPDQLQWAGDIPRHEPNRIETVALRRRSAQINFGFQIRGGFDQRQPHAIYDNDDDELDDNGCSFFFVDSVAPKSIAWHTGSLFAGQRILSVDNMSLRRTTMSELLMYIDQRLCITLRVCHYGMLPVRDEVADPLQWQFVEQFERQRIKKRRPSSMAGGCLGDEVATTTLCKIRDEQTTTKFHTIDKKIDQRCHGHSLLPVRVCILDTRGAPLGIAVVGRSGRDGGAGLFITDVEHESLADRAGLRPGDRILEINGYIVETIDSTLTDDWLTGKSATLGYYKRQFPEGTRKERERWSRRFCSFDQALSLLRNSRTLDLRVAKS